MQISNNFPENVILVNLGNCPEVPHGGALSDMNGVGSDEYTFWKFCFISHIKLLTKYYETLINIVTKKIYIKLKKRCHS